MEAPISSSTGLEFFQFKINLLKIYITGFKVTLNKVVQCIMTKSGSTYVYMHNLL